MASLRSAICERAKFWASPGEWLPTASHLVDFFKGAGTERVPSLSDAERSLKYLTTGVYLDKTTIRHWCGIFACSVLREKGVNVRWTLNGGKMVGGVKLVWGHSGLQPGDVAIIEKGQHHFLVISADYSANALVTVEGNTSGQKIRQRSRKITGGGGESPYAYYTLA